MYVLYFIIQFFFSKYEASSFYSYGYMQWIFSFLFFDLEELVATEKFDIIAITDSWLNTKDRDFLAEYNLPG